MTEIEIIAQDMLHNEVLMACPFCGNTVLGIARTYYNGEERFWVRCAYVIDSKINGCGCGQDPRFHNTVEDCTKAWNKRQGENEIVEKTLISIKRCVVDRIVFRLQAACKEDA